MSNNHYFSSAASKKAEQATQLLIRSLRKTDTLTIIIFLAIYIFILYKLCKMVKTNVEKHNSKKTTIAITITVFICLPFAIGQLIYMYIKWGDTTEKIILRPKITQINYPKPYKDDYERWKEERLKEQQKKE